MSPPENAAGAGLPAGEGAAPADFVAALGRNERALWTVAAAALLADVLTTLAGLQAGLAEGNPVIAGALADAGVLGFLGVKVGVFCLAVGVRVVLPRFRGVVPLGIAIPWALAALSNVVLLAATI